ncbi:Hypothetical protein, putative [Bodo saltans]|uniref:Membrane-associated protein n=1 Tax=Bodo saltans TaxID=75058 RepID=A0A0S4JP05_BODSA|nr:Hypothetical protein, putative [Bodo saltans]|eukprot:CUG93282.1 Hypothetical protein, putative [Bodo saltans]
MKVQGISALSCRFLIALASTRVHNSCFICACSAKKKYPQMRFLSLWAANCSLS